MIKKRLTSDPKTVQIMYTVALFLITLYAFWLLKNVFLAGIIGFIIYGILYRWHKRVKSSTKSTFIAFLSSSVILLLSVGVCIAVVVYLTIDLTQQTEDLFWSVSQNLPASVTSLVETLDFGNVIDYVRENSDIIKQQAESILSGVSRFITVFWLSIVFAFIFLSEPKWISQIGKKLNSYTKKDIQSLCTEARSLLYTWFWQQAKVGLILAGMILVYMLCLRWYAWEPVGNIFMISVLGFLGEFFPIIGPFLSWVPVGAASFWVSPIAGYISIGFFLLVQVVEGYILIPQLVGEKLKMPASWSILLLIISGTLFGVLGVIISLPLGSLLYQKLQKK